ncbi:MAG: hypothetical protein JSV63_02930 [Candidatus Aenigmatarchaeota archaeon]|nr:MAG: hypothetical protein JSV63_02930 [Candidatus Aenigmarchaeota archaeon]
MEGSKMIVAASLALILISFFWVNSALLLRPYLQKGFLTLDDSIATYIDTLASVESGNVKMEVERGLVKNINIVFENEGEKDGYIVVEPGWYVVVTYRSWDKEIKDASIINTYPAGEEFGKRFLSPQEICINKNEDSLYAEVGRC